MDLNTKPVQCARDLQDIAVFESLFEKYAETLYRYALMHVGSREEAEDILSTTFARIWEYAGRYPDRPIRSIKALLYRTAGNILIDHWRKKRPAVSLEILMEQGIEIPEAVHLSQDDKTDIKIILGTFRSLSALERSILTLRFVEDLSIAEIADIHELTENHVAVKIHRTLKKVRGHFMERDK